MPCRIRLLLQLTAVLHLMPVQYGTTPLSIACQEGHVAVVKELLSRGAAVDKAEQVHCGLAALVFSAQCVHLPLLTRCRRVIIH